MESNALLPQEIDRMFINEFHQQMNIHTRDFIGSISTPQTTANRQP